MPLFLKLLLCAVTLGAVILLGVWMRNRFLLTGGSFVFNSPADIPNLIAWYRADLGVTLDTGKVSVWADQSGNGNDAVQTTPADRPVVTAAALGGQDAITFSGAERLTIAGSLAATSATAVAVYKNTSTAGSLSGYSCIVAPLDHIELWTITGTGYAAPSFIGPNASVANGSAFDQADVRDLNDHAIIVKWNGGDVSDPASYSGSLDLVAKSIVNTGAFNVRTSSSIGDRNADGYTMIGHIAEIILVGSVISSQVETALNAYLSDRYGL